MVQVPSVYSTIQRAKIPAIIAKIAATPPFPTKEVAGDEVLGDEAAELPDSVEELVGTAEPAEPVDVPLTETLAPEDTADDAALALALALAVTLAPALALALPELAAVVNGIELVALGVPVALREPVEKERISSRTLNNHSKKKIRYLDHIVHFVKQEQIVHHRDSLLQDKQRRRLGIEHLCTRR